MMNLRVQDWSKMKDDARAKLWSDLKIRINTKPKKKVTLSNEDLDNWLRSTLNGR